MTWRDRCVSDLAEILVATPRQRTIGMKTPPRKRAGYRMSTAMVSAPKMRAAEAVSPAAEMRAAKSMAPAVPTAVTSSTMAATALGDRGTRQRGHEHNDRNSDHAS
jgi:hypothetical protein